MALERQPRRANGSRPDPTRSVRISDALWLTAKRRASYEGVTMSRATNLLLEGYARGAIDLPSISKTYGREEAVSE